MLKVPVHAPVQKLKRENERIGPNGLSEIRDLVHQTGVLGQPDKIDGPIGDERGKRDEQGQDPEAGANGHDDHGPVEGQQEPGPPYGVPVLVRLVGMEGIDPFVGTVLPTGRLERGVNPSNETVAKRPASLGQDVDGEHLEQEGFTHGWFNG